MPRRPADRNCRNIAIALTDLQKDEETAQACDIAFHEKAGRSQVHFFFSFFLLNGEGVQSGAEPSRARCVRRPRTLDGENRSAIISAKKEERTA